MKKVTFIIPPEEFKRLMLLYSNTGKNSHVGKLGVEIAKLYFNSQDNEVTFLENKMGVDLAVSIKGVTENYEVKGTADKDISWIKIKVSSTQCYNHLVNGMTLIRITNIGFPEVTLFFLKYGEDFNLKPEPRWSVIPKKK